VGDRESHLDFAQGQLAGLLQHPHFSSRFDTAPVGVIGDQLRYLNAAAIGHTRLTARELLHALQAIESARGRERPYANAPRTLDLDLILFGDQVVDEPGLRVPHPRFRDRRFVLEPLGEIAASMVDPVTGQTVAELLARL
jgi:2-amino-4-hydroxy-6-hydroxymethyldihydropteridine diphosphokinase